jgi:hypothetical protein
VRLLTPASASDVARSRPRVLHLLLESAVYDGIKGALEFQFYPLGISRLAAEAAMVGQANKEAA